VCTETAPENLLRHPQEGAANLAEGFRTRNPCWGTGIYLAKGRLDTVRVEMAEPYLDGPKVADIMGFRDNSLRYLAGLPLRRWWTADWFQPIARIGNRGNVEWVLQASDGATAPELADDAELPWQATSSFCEGTLAPDPALIRTFRRARPSGGASYPSSRRPRPGSSSSTSMMRSRRFHSDRWSRASTGTAAGRRSRSS
jgi:hypothetical protein